MMRKILILITLLGLSLLGFSQEIKWISFEKAVELNKTTPKKIIVDVYTDWCHWCKVMDKQTFSNPKIAELISKDFYAVKLNAEGKDKITFQDKEFNFVPSGQRGVHELAYALLGGQMSFPSLVFLDQENKMIDKIPGYLKPADLEPLLHIVKDELYKDKEKLESFRKTFKSKL